ncbi:hypothetical protein PCAR4_200025 [Paraburkholderia caribensis]|nr:hypothetical protein PCAR4_200025 [Paraburkholderia caribensis]
MRSRRSSRVARAWYRVQFGWRLTFAVADVTVARKGAKLKAVAIKNIRPTQLTHGLREIAQKTQFYEL